MDLLWLVDIVAILKSTDSVYCKLNQSSRDSVASFLASGVTKQVPKQHAICHNYMY